DDLLDRDEVPDQEAADGRAGAGAGALVVRVREVRGCHHGLDAREREGLRNVNPLDVGVGVRTRLQARVEHLRQMDVCRVVRVPGDLVHAVRTDRGRPDNAKVFLDRSHAASFPTESRLIHAGVYVRIPTNGYARPGYQARPGGALFRPEYGVSSIDA